LLTPSCPPSMAGKAQRQSTSLTSKELTICKSQGIWQKLRSQSNLVQQQLISLGNGEDGTLLSNNPYAFNPPLLLVTLNPFPTSKFTCHHPPRRHSSNQSTRAPRPKELNEQQHPAHPDPQRASYEGQRPQVLPETSRSRSGLFLLPPATDVFYALTGKISPAGRILQAG